jgi:hypothetical protein
VESLNERVKSERRAGKRIERGNKKMNDRGGRRIGRGKEKGERREYSTAQHSTKQYSTV